jgi:hypothetical protein
VWGGGGIPCGCAPEVNVLAILFGFAPSASNKIISYLLTVISC